MLTIFRWFLQTYTGSILIAVNPFQRLPHLYNNHMMEQYKGMALGELSPHPFAIADAAYRQYFVFFRMFKHWYASYFWCSFRQVHWTSGYRQMIHEGISQSILVSGESGAGKTESTKMLMQYLAYMGGRVAAEGRTVEQKVLEVCTWIKFVYSMDWCIVFLFLSYPISLSSQKGQITKTELSEHLRLLLFLSHLKFPSFPAFCSQIQFWKHLAMQRQWETIIQGFPIFASKYNFVLWLSLIYCFEFCVKR